MEGSRTPGSSIADVDPAIAGSPAARESDWRQALPELRGEMATLREPRLGDAAALWSTMSRDEVARFMSSPPGSVEGFERFIAWMQRERAAGNFVCFVVVPRGTDEPAGIFQVRRLDAAFETAEWGFAIGPRFWGTGLYAEAAVMVLEFVFVVVGAHRLEARAAVTNGRGNGALRKMGATRERVLHQSLLKDGEHMDQALWTIRGRDWLRIRPGHATPVH